MTSTWRRRKSWQGYLLTRLSAGYTGRPDTLDSKILMLWVGRAITPYLWYSTGGVNTVQPKHVALSDALITTVGSAVLTEFSQVFWVEMWQCEGHNMIHILLIKTIQWPFMPSEEAPAFSIHSGFSFHLICNLTLETHSSGSDFLSPIFYYVLHVV